MKTRKFLSLALVLALCLGLLPLTAAATGGEYNREHSYFHRFYLPQKGSSKTMTFEVPTTGHVSIQVANDDDSSLPPHYRCVLSGPDGVIEERVLKNVKWTSSYTFARVKLEPGTYTVKVSYDLTTSIFFAHWPDIEVSVAWDYSCAHEGEIVEGERLEPTCTKEGYQKYTCTICNEEVPEREETFERLPHTPSGEWQVTEEPRCYAAGEQVQLCTVCGEVALMEYVDKLDHEYGPWTEVREGTCLLAGERVRTCALCGIDDTEPLNSDADRAHDFGPWETVKEPSCLEAGKRAHVCGVCGLEETQLMDSEADRAHAFGPWETVAKATDTADGKRRRTCAVCGYNEDETIPKTSQSSPAVSQGLSPQSTGTAYPSGQIVDVDGKSVTFQCYALKDEAGNQTNYIKLRDLAYILNRTAAQFEIGWDGRFATITTGAPYTANGSERHTPFSGNRTYFSENAATTVNGQPVTLDAFVLYDDRGGGYTYYKLRDLAQALGFNIGWNGVNVYVETDQPYDPSN